MLNVLSELIEQCAQALEQRSLTHACNGAAPQAIKFAQQAEAVRDFLSDLAKLAQSSDHNQDI